MSWLMECDVLGDSGRTDPFLHRLLGPAPFQTFENQSCLFRAVAYQSQRFIANRDDVLCLGLLCDGVDTFPSSSKVHDFFPAKGKHIAEPQTGQTRKEGSGLQNRYLARGFGKAIQLFHTQILLGNIFRFDFFQKVIDMALSRYSRNLLHRSTSISSKVHLPWTKL